MTMAIREQEAHTSLRRHDNDDALKLELEPLHIDSDAPRPEHARKPKTVWMTLSSRYLVVLLVVLLVGAVFDDVSVRLERPAPSGKNSTSAMDADQTEPTEDQDEPTAVRPKFSVLPRKLFSVIGLESSGTQFVTKLIQNAVDPQSEYREGSFRCNGSCKEKNQVQVQHFSLPWGSTCSIHPDPPVVDIVLPAQCLRDQFDPREREECDALARGAWNISLHGRPKKYPPRYQLDIVASRRWHAAQGVDQVFVIVVRDQTISNVARGISHCKNYNLRKREEEVGTALILDAVNALILSRDEDKLNKTTYKRWVARKYQRRRRLRALPSGEGAVLVSYESLVKLGDTYVQMLFETLGINSTRRVGVKDSNHKYINGHLH